ncbi:unnamed protein product [Musa hybrid cultivar]
MNFASEWLLSQATPELSLTCIKRMRRPPGSVTAAAEAHRSVILRGRARRSDRGTDLCSRSPPPLPPPRPSRSPPSIFLSRHWSPSSLPCPSSCSSSSSRHHQRRRPTPRSPPSRTPAATSTPAASPSPPSPRRRSSRRRIWPPPAFGGGWRRTPRPRCR